MEGNELAKKVPLDESLLDPLLRSGTAKAHEGDAVNTQPSASGSVPGPVPPRALSLATARASSQGPGHDSAPRFPYNDAWWDSFEDDICDRNSAYPGSSYKSLDDVINSESASMRDDERYWLMGLQAGIGLGIHTTREALLNEVQNNNSVWGLPIQRDPSRSDPNTERRKLGELCQGGFDRHVAYRAANSWNRSRNQIADMVVYNGLTECLPGTGDHMIGTSTLFSKGDVEKCHSNARVLREAQGAAGNQQQLNLLTRNGSGTERPAPPTASFLGDGSSIAGVDMTQLSGTAGIIANACVNGVGGSGSRGIRDEYFMTEKLAPAPEIFRGMKYAKPSCESEDDDAESEVK
ncbi:hypothetical protein F5Y07DRAFT_61217 [Xylaria sp. FL0933]|nr:hypothetical protein F5Y07DRAFT_61217 [Xylaria sp. FL0933]